MKIYELFNFKLNEENTTDVTVKELIHILKNMDQNAKVVVINKSEVRGLTRADITEHNNEEVDTDDGYRIKNYISFDPWS